MANSIKTMRRDLAMTQAQFGTMVGVTRNTVARWERGELGMRPTTKRLIGIIVEQQRLIAALSTAEKLGSELRQTAAAVSATTASLSRSLNDSRELRERAIGVNENLQVLCQRIWNNRFG
jgi:DNA-binding XRE family transcriptional regulator